MVPPLPSCLEKTNNPNLKMHWCLRMKNVILRYGSSVNPEKWWILHPWQYSWPGEMGFWATWCSEWHPCPGRGVDLDDLSVSFQLKPFCDPVVLSALWGSWSTASGYNSHRAFPLLVVLLLLLLLLLLLSLLLAPGALLVSGGCCKGLCPPRYSEAVWPQPLLRSKSSKPACSLFCLWTSADNQGFLPSAPSEGTGAKSNNGISQLKTVAPVSVFWQYSGHQLCVFLKRVCSMALLDYCLSTGFILNLYIYFFNRITSFISRVFPYCHLFKEALSASNVLLFLACLDDWAELFPHSFLMTLYLEL